MRHHLEANNQLLLDGAMCLIWYCSLSQRHLCELICIGCWCGIWNMLMMQWLLSIITYYIYRHVQCTQVWSLTFMMSYTIFTLNGKGTFRWYDSSIHDVWSRNGYFTFYTSEQLRSRGCVVVSEKRGQQCKKQQKRQSLILLWVF